jgi:hypothetical protein
MHRGGRVVPDPGEGSDEGAAPLAGVDVLLGELALLRRRRRAEELEQPGLVQAIHAARIEDPRYRDLVPSDPTGPIERSEISAGSGGRSPPSSIASALEARPAGALSGEERFARQSARSTRRAHRGAQVTDLTTIRRAEGDPAAIAAFESHLGADAVRALAKLGVRGPAADEIQQRVRHKLFVPADGAEPKIAGYTGRGPLRAWLRALTAHEALSEYRKQARETTTPTRRSASCRR